MQCSQDIGHADLANRCHASFLRRSMIADFVTGKVEKRYGVALKGRNDRSRRSPRCKRNRYELTIVSG